MQISSLARPRTALAVLASLALACGGPPEHAEGAGPADSSLATAQTNSPGDVERGSERSAERHVWPSWRGPERNGTSRETGLVDAITLDGDEHLWTVPLSGRGTPVVSGDRVFALGYVGEEGELREKLVCLDLATGETLWEHVWSDFLSDVVYDRYAIGSPTVDPETGWVYALSTPGILMAVDPAGELQWSHSLMSEYGRLTFPNGRTGSPLVFEDRLIVRCITSGWGPQAPAGDRFLAFDKITGENLWITLPGKIPKDNSLALARLTEHDGRAMLVSGTGCGHVVGIDARTGQTLWRYPVSVGGLNSSVVEFEGGVIAIHGRENLDSSVIGRMVSLRYPDLAALGADDGPLELDASSERWRNDHGAFSSSPVLVGDRIYQTVTHGDLVAVDARTGETLWHEKLAPDQIHASPVAADGKLFVPTTNGMFRVIRPTATGPDILSEVQLEGNCLGAPAIARGRILVHTTKQLYCFGRPGPAPVPLASAEPPRMPRAVPAQGLRIVPADFVARPGDRVRLAVRGVAPGVANATLPATREVTWSAPDRLGASVEGDTLVLDGGMPGVGHIEARIGDLTGTARLRVLPPLSYAEDFEGFELAPGSDGVPVADPPPFWLGGKKKWDVRELEGSKVLAKSLAVPLFQRTLTLFGEPDDANYEMRVDLRTDGSRRTLSTAGLIHQRYLVLLKGNYRELEVSSNVERLKESVPFPIEADVWYTLRTRVDVNADGSGMVRAKAWPRDEPEPEAWTIEVPHADAHRHGSPGLFGFAPQSRFRVYADNLSVTPL